MQDPNADTEWNDVLRKQGIIPQRQKQEKEITEDQVVQLLENTVQEKVNCVKKQDGYSSEELDELEDANNDSFFLEYRAKRIAKMKADAMKAKFGDVREISAEDYVEQVNRAGDGIWVILHLYKQGIPLCSLINSYINQLAAKFPATKFLKSVSDVCIPNFPDQNLPTIFVYFEGQMKKQFIGPEQCGGLNLKLDELEWMLSETGAVLTDLEYNPRKQIKDVLFTALTNTNENDDW